APDIDGGVGAEEAEQAALADIDQKRNSQPVAGRCNRCLLDLDRERAAAVLGKGLADDLRLQEAAHFGERNVDRHGDADRVVGRLRHQIEMLRERTLWLRLVW